MAVLEAGRRRRRVSPWPLLDALEERVLLSRALQPVPHEPPALVQPATMAPHHAAQAIHPLDAGPGLRDRPLNHGPGRRHALPGAARWSWLANTYWCVPPTNLPSVLFDSTSQKLVPLADQTVFHITGYRDGYFWGVTVTQLGSLSPTCSSLVGSVTPQGRVLLNFTAMGDSSSPTITQGIGQMRVKFGQWTMENQMFTSPSDQVQVGHWAYMVQTRPGLPSWNSLPGVGVSVPDFLSNCQGQGPQPIGPGTSARG